MVRASLYRGQGKDPLLHPLMFGLVDYFVFTFPEKFVTEGCNFIAGCHYVSQVVTSDEGTIFDGRYSGR